MVKYQELWNEENTNIRERYDLAMERILEIPSEERVAEPYRSYFNQMAAFTAQIEELARLQLREDLDAFTLEELQQEWTRMAYEKYTTEVPLKEGVREFITSLKERNVKLGIGTSNGRELVDATLQALDIEQYFDSVHTSCEVETGKPSPDIYLLVAEDLGVDPSRCLVFEDVPNGILAGKNAGMRTCAVYDQYSRDQEDKKKEMADYYIDSYMELGSAE